MRITLDTNAYVDFCRNETDSVAVIQRAEQIFLPFIVIAELRAGFLCGDRSRKNEKVLSLFLASERVEILYADNQTTHHYARLFHQLRAQGTPIPTNDLWIAALTSQHQLLLYSRDRHFNRLPQLPRV